MMEKGKNIKNKWLHVRLSEEEYAQLQKQFSKTTEKKLSTYARKILLGKPMIAGVRNLSFQDIVTVLFKLRTDLSGIANNFNQMVHKLHTLERSSEFRAWLERYDREHKKLMEMVEEIRSYIHKTAAQWLQ